MSTTLPTLAAQLTAAGMVLPSVEDMLATQIAKYQAIFGIDASTEPDDQDLQLESVRIAAINDCNQLALAVYTSFLLAYAQGVGLASLVQLLGLQKEVATNSTVPCQLVGQSGIIVQQGIVRDQTGNLWNLPDVVTIPDAGQITVTATAQQPGAISAQAGTVTPYTIVAGWQTASFTATATLGAPIETDAALRRRAAASTALPAQGPLDAIMAAVANSGGVGRYRGYENPTPTTDANGLPPSAIAVVVEGGTAATIAAVIQQKKAPGTPTYGTTQVILFDQQNLPVPIRFFELTETTIYFSVRIQSLNGWVASTATVILNAVAAAINALAIGQTVYLNWLIAVASLPGNALANTFTILQIQIGVSSGSLGPSDVPILFNAAAQTTVANGSTTVL